MGVTARKDRENSGVSSAEEWVEKKHFHTNGNVEIFSNGSLTRNVEIFSNG
jgi:hypothetical protein